MPRSPKPCIVWKFLLLLRLSIHLVSPSTFLKPTTPNPNPLETIIIQPPGNAFQSSVSLLLSVPSILYPRRQNFKPPLLSLPSGNPPGGWLIALLLLSGDIESNPGPRSIEDPCGICHKSCTENQLAIQCDSCDAWIHKKCSKINRKIWPILKRTSLTWECINCGIPNFSDSFFDDLISRPFTKNKFSVLSNLKDQNSNHATPIKSRPPNNCPSNKKTPSLPSLPSPSTSPANLKKLTQPSSENNSPPNKKTPSPRPCLAPVPLK